MDTKLLKCLKCGCSFSSDNLKNKSIYTMLCDVCRINWINFYEKNHVELNIEFPKKHNPAWDVFLGKIPREVVEFT
jgi:hypothetical protein